MKIVHNFKTKKSTNKSLFEIELLLDELSFNVLSRFLIKLNKKPRISPRPS